MTIREKEHAAELEAFEAKLIGTLKTLGVALQKFTQRAMEANTEIFSHEVFNEMIKMHSEDKMETILQKMQALVKYLNIGEDNKYRFYDLDSKNKKLTKMADKINTISVKVIQALEDLLSQLQEKNATISKV